MSDKKRKLDELAKDVGEVKSGLEALSRRVERLEKSTCVVVECSSKLEAVYAKAEQDKDFRRVAKEGAEAVLADLAEATGLPYPLQGDTGAHDWQRQHPTFELTTVLSWFSLVPALLLGVRFVAPNKLRSTLDASTRQRTRSPGHFILKLEFSDLSLQVQRALQSGFGQFLGCMNKRKREAGETGLVAVYLHRTTEELERKRARAAASADGGGGGGGGGKGRGRGKGRGKGRK
jgi:hypothetical protein